MLKHPLLLRVRLGHLADPARLRALVAEHIERTRGELRQVRDAPARARGVEEWADPQVALRWSERQQLAELELAQALAEDLARMARAPRQDAQDAPTHG
ncbi:hypothetical protein NLX86_11545 [Streptomyces sp. A3M-1-3]|uniref:hypothetical protein n=1 Tax=Streptomyces sp. A3M-1-3 TaxID=2962044 RepID=UPI0020B8A426|nr:hypothetical protein [Streptomyces sp. A3M-1-3]MCP3818724.1 hypothetical protein [Streptomyces sp. A3M-1-3]